MFDDNKPNYEPYRPQPPAIEPEKKPEAQDVYTMPEKFISKDGKGGKSKKVLLIVLLLIVVFGGVAYGAVILFNRLSTNANTNANANLVNNANINLNGNKNANTNLNTNTNGNLNLNTNTNTNANTNLNTNANSNLEEYREVNGLYTINIPKGWHDRAIQSNGSGYFMPTDTSSGLMISLIIEDRNEDITNISEALDILTDNETSNINVSVINSNETKLDGYDAMIYTGRMDTAEPLEFVTGFILYAKTQVTITGAAEVGSLSTYKDLYEESIRSFRLLKDQGLSLNTNVNSNVNANANISRLDSDNDGLTDAEEATYGTDKNKADSDGDGYDDLTEISGGYNPNGPGKL